MKSSAKSTPGEGFTPGPWYVHAPEPALPFYISSSAESHHSGEVAVLYGKDSGPDARLIAAAPDLLDALEELVDVLPCQNGCKPDDMTCATMRARAVIKKARGQ